MVSCKQGGIIRLSSHLLSPGSFFNGLLMTMVDRNCQVLWPASEAGRPPLTKRPWREWLGWVCRAPHVQGVVCLALVVSAWVPGVGAAEKIAATLIVKDALTMPKKPVMLEVRLVETGILGETALGGEPVEFFVGGVRAGTAMTGGDGRALLEFTTRMRGNQIIRVTVAGSPRVQNAEATANLFSWERRRPIILVELAALVEEGKLRGGFPALPLPMNLKSLPPPVSGAVTNLEKLTKYYFNVVYLSRTGNVELDTLVGWLKEHEFSKFSPGMPVVVKPGKKSLGAILEDFQEKGFTNIKGGIGRTREFADTFAERRLKVVILSEKGPNRTYPRKAQWAKDWLEVRKKLQG